MMSAIESPPLSVSKFPPASSAQEERQSVNLGILGTGGMARQHAERFQKMPGCKVVAGADSDRAKAGEFCVRHSIPLACGGIEELLAVPGLTAVAIVVPDPFHSSLAIRCLEAGKHVFCEKPLATNADEAFGMLEAARQSGKIHMVNFSFRNLPALQTVARVIADGTLGAIRHVEGSFLQSWLTATLDGGWQASPPLLWRLSAAHGSKGVLGDVGVHLLDFATCAVGPLRQVHCRLKTFSKAPKDCIGEYVLDANDSAIITAEFEGGALGTLHTTRWAAGNGNRVALRVFGSEGAVEIDTDLGRDRYRLCAGEDLHTHVWRTLDAPAVPSTYERFVRAIETDRQDAPDFAQGWEVQRALDACFESAATGREITLSRHPKKLHRE